jgi:hypothetical protein
MTWGGILSPIFSLVNSPKLQYCPSSWTNACISYDTCGLHYRRMTAVVILLQLHRGKIGNSSTGQGGYPLTDGCYEECVSRLNGLIVRAAEVLATADEVQRLFRIFSQWFRPTNFHETDRTLERLIVGLNFQQLTF